MNTLIIPFHLLSESHLRQNILLVIVAYSPSKSHIHIIM